MYKIINWYTQRFRFPRRGLKFFTGFLKMLGIYDKEYCKKLHNGSLIYVNPADHIQRQLFWYGYYEKESILTWESLLTKEMTVLDIGANSGYYSVIASSKAKMIYAFEPSAVIRMSLEKNVQLNRCSNISIQPFALSDGTGQATLYQAGPDNSGMTGLTKPGNFSGQTEMLQTISLDEWMTTMQLNGADLVKIDVEGAEMKVLAGMKDTLSRCQPVIFIEVINELLNRFGNNSTEVFHYFADAGYSAYEISRPFVLKTIARPIESYSVLFLPAGYSLPGTLKIE